MPTFAIRSQLQVLFSLLLPGAAAKICTCTHVLIKTRELFQNQTIKMLIGELINAGGGIAFGRSIIGLYYFPLAAFSIRVM